MNLDGMLRAWTPGLNEQIGAETIVLRRPVALTDGKLSEAPEALEIAANATAGAGAVSLRLPGGKPLRGTLRAGSTLQIGGQLYQVALDTLAAGNALSEVQLLRSLTGAATAGDPVEIVSGAEFTFEHCRVPVVSREEAGAILAGQLLFNVVIPMEDATTEPRVGDTIYRPVAGVSGRIVAIPEAVGGAWICRVGPRQKAGRL
jgi:hypothetical protein